jgi:hypothetical protein
VADMRRCTKCGCEKPVKEFHRHSKRGYQTWCKACKNSQHKEYWERRGRAVRFGLNPVEPYVGSRRGNAKIDEHDVCLIRQLRDLHAKEVGEKFGLSDGHVRAIWRGATWRHVA